MGRIRRRRKQCLVRPQLEQLESRRVLTTPFPLGQLYADQGGDGVAGLVLKGADDGDQTGESVAGIGDVNGDGIDDMAIGAMGTDANGFSSGTVYVVFGKSNHGAEIELGSLSSSDGVAIFGPNAGDGLGNRVFGIGDINDDDVDDLLVRSNSGRAFLIYGSNSFPSSINLSLPDGIVSTEIVYSQSTSGNAAGVGDVNDDTVDDFAIEAGNGSLFVVYGTSGGYGAMLDLTSLSATEGATISGLSAFSVNPNSVSGAGDINGDDIDDVVIGNSSQRDVYLIYGKAGGIDSAIDVTAIAASAGQTIQTNIFGFGESVSGGLDVNGDGLDDLMVGAPDTQGDEFHSGSVFVIMGRPGGLPSNLDPLTLDGTNGFEFRGVMQNGEAGRTGTLMPDVNGDALADILVGVPGTLSNEHRRAYVIFGSSEAFPPLLDGNDINGQNGFRIDAGSDELFTAASVDFAGDLNNDGVGDILIGASQYAGGFGNVAPPGEAYLIYGTDFVGNLPRASVVPAQVSEAESPVQLAIGSPFSIPLQWTALVDRVPTTQYIFRPENVLIADFDGDGALDTAVNHEQDPLFATTASVSVFLNDRNGGMRFAGRGDLDDVAEEMVAQDIDNDSDMDIVTTNPDSGSVSVLINGGHGNISRVFHFDTTNSPKALAVTDLDGNDHPEIIYSGSSPASFGFLTNFGGGVFGAESLLTVSSNIASLQAIDIDKDGDNDIVTAHEDGVRIWENDGTGGLTEASLLSYDIPDGLEIPPVDLLVGDFDGDGKVDIAVTHANSFSTANSRLTLIWNDGNGVFSVAPAISIPGKPVRSDSGDLNGDGRLDVAYSFDLSYIAVTYGAGDRAFGDTVEYIIGEDSTAINVIDIDGNGTDDIISTSVGCNGTGFSGCDDPIPAELKILVQNELNGLQGARNWSTGTGPVAIAAIDFDGDGDDDVVSTRKVSDFSGASYDLSLMRNDGGDFAFPAFIALDDAPSDVTSADFDGDGDLDIAVASERGETVAILKNDGAGRFSAPVSWNSGGDTIRVIQGDLDNDNDIDILTVSDFDNRLGIMLNNGQAAFATLNIDGVSASDAVLIDANGDSLKDIVVSGTWTHLLINQGNLQFSDPVRLFQKGELLLSGDFDDDGDQDLVASLSGFSNPVYLFENDGDGVFTEGQLLFQGDNVNSLASKDLDGDGDLDIVASEAESGLTAQDGKLWVVENEGGAFLPASRLPAMQLTRVGLADLGGDGLPEVIALAPTYDSFSVYPNLSHGVSQLSFTVQLTAPSSQVVEVDYSTSGTTANPLLDFEPVRGTLAIAAGETQGNVSIVVRDDLVDELAETLQLEITSSRNAVVAGSTATGTIDDDDASLSLEATTVQLTEGGDGVHLVLQRNDVGNASEPLIVAISPDRPGQLAVAASVDFGANETEVHVPIAAIADAAMEGVHEVNVSFTASGYRGISILAEILESNGWQNPVRANDVNGDGNVEPLDALLIINYINNNGNGTAPPAAPEMPPPFYDVDGDGLVAARDALLVINELNSPAVDPTSVLPFSAMVLRERKRASLLANAACRDYLYCRLEVD